MVGRRAGRHIGRRTMIAPHRTMPSTLHTTGKECCSFCQIALLRLMKTQLAHHANIYQDSGKSIRLRITATTTQLLTVTTLVGCAAYARKILNFMYEILPASSLPTVYSYWTHSRLPCCLFILVT